jgi:hypothetical protein
MRCKIKGLDYTFKNAYNVILVFMRVIVMSKKEKKFQSFECPECKTETKLEVGHKWPEMLTCTKCEFAYSRLDTEPTVRGAIKKTQIDDSNDLEIIQKFAESSFEIDLS